MASTHASGLRGRVARVSLVLTLVVAATLIWTGLPVSAAVDGHCKNMSVVKVRGAEKQEAACLDDMTTFAIRATTYTDVSDWATLHSQQSLNPRGVPGIQIDGYFPDTSTFNTYRGWNHDAQFVLRFPDNWNGKLVITGAPGIRKQYSNDYIISDWVIARGYAFASTDKGNSGNTSYKDGATPGDALAEWHRRVYELTLAAKDAVRQRYGRLPARTYMTGISNGGYLTRYALEKHSDQYDGGVDWEGTLMLAQGPNIFTYLPVALRNYPKYKATGDKAAHDAMIKAGFEPGSEFLWDYHYGVYWDLTQRSYREEFDPAYDGSIEGGVPFCQPGTVPGCDADYNYAARPQAVKDAVKKVALTGVINKKLLTLHGTLDALLPIKTDSDVYTNMIRSAGLSGAHRYYVIEGGNHVDGLYDEHPDTLRPILPCYREAFEALENWIERAVPPPPSRKIPRLQGPQLDLANSCSLS